MRGGKIRPNGMGCSPLNGNSQVVTPTMRTGGRSSDRALPHCRSRSHAAPATTRKSPATGLAIVDSAAHTVAMTTRRPFMCARTAPSPKATPSMNVERPDTTWHHSENPTTRAGHRGLRMPVRSTIDAASQVDETPDRSVTGTTPNSAIR